MNAMCLGILFSPSPATKREDTKDRIERMDSRRCSRRDESSVFIVVLIVIIKESTRVDARVSNFGAFRGNFSRGKSTLFKGSIEKDLIRHSSSSSSSLASDTLSACACVCVSARELPRNLILTVFCCNLC